MSAQKGEHVEVNEEEARAGETGHHVRYILAIGLLLAALGLSVIWLGWLG